MVKILFSVKFEDERLERSGFQRRPPLRAFMGSVPMCDRQPASYVPAFTRVKLSHPVTVSRVDERPAQRSLLPCASHGLTLAPLAKTRTKAVTMRLSKYFMPLLKEAPKEAQVTSHRLMLRAGMIQQSSAGIYSWLPLGKRVLDKIENIVREEQNRAGAIEILMPTIQPAELWQESGRYDDYGAEMLRITDRHERQMLYGPTNEEQVTDIFRAHVKSYRELPLNLYHIQWKFRDEVRPRFGIMRGREFLMKDAYSFDLDADDARAAYNRMFVSYLKTFARMGLTAIPMEAETGPIGGNMSHEFIILADTGESRVYFHKDWLNTERLTDVVEHLDDSENLKHVVKQFTALYARADEKHDPKKCVVDPQNLRERRGIEVGHIFHFGEKYSKAMGAKVAGRDGREKTVHMGSYGIGVSRLVGSIIEASHDEKGIIWPRSVAPFDWVVINLNVADEKCSACADFIYNFLLKMGMDVLLDDRDERPGAKLASMDLIGVPSQAIIGPRGIEKGTFEMKDRASGKTLEIPINTRNELDGPFYEQWEEEVIKLLPETVHQLAPASIEMPTKNVYRRIMED